MRTAVASGILVPEEPRDPHRVVEPSLVHVDPEEPQVRVPHPDVAPRAADPVQETAGDVLVPLGLHFGGPGEVEVDHRGGEQIRVEPGGAARKAVEVFLGLVFQPTHRKRHAGAQRRREVAAPIDREPGGVGVEVDLLGAGPGGDQAGDCRSDCYGRKPPAGADVPHPVSASIASKTEATLPSAFGPAPPLPCRSGRPEDVD